MTDFWQEFSYTLRQTGAQQLALVILAHSGDQSVINQERLQTESEENWSFEKGTVYCVQKLDFGVLALIKSASLPGALSASNQTVTSPEPRH